jgi:hypothetical protein
MATTETPNWGWGGIDPAEWLRTWQMAWRGAPETLVQPILPGWTLNINSSNSSSPQTEVDVVARHSYGRQIGRIADALEALIAGQHAAAPKDKRLAEFLSMKREVDEVKEAAAAARLDRISRDLALLREKRPTEYARLREVLRQALK